MARVVLTALLAAGFATSAIVRSCQDFMIPLDISARNGVFNLSVPTSNIEVTNFVLNLSQVGTNYTAVALENVSQCPPAPFPAERKGSGGDRLTSSPHSTPPSQATTSSR